MTVSNGWVVVDEALLKGRMTAREWEVMDSAARSAAGVSPAAECIASVVMEVRGYVSGCPRNALGPVGTVPAECVNATLELLREAMAAMVPGSPVVVDETRKETIRQARRFLEKVAECRVAVTQPVGGESGSVAGTAAAPVDVPAGGSEGRIY